MWVGFLCYDQEKVSWLVVVCLADSDWTSAEALGCSQSSCLCINPRHTLQLWPHWASIAAVIQLPGRETCTASQADNNQPGLENSGLLPRCQQSMFLCLLAGHRAAGGPSVVSSRQLVIFRHHFSVIIVNNFGSAHGYLKETLWVLKSTSDRINGSQEVLNIVMLWLHLYSDLPLLWQAGLKVG